MQDGIPLPRRYGAIAAIALGVSLSVLDGTIANVALPTIAGDLRISPASSIWVVNAYQLAIVVSLLALSSLGDLIGYRKIYLGGLIVFTLASLGCVLSRSLAELTVARTVQGFGAAAVSSVNTALIRVIYPRRYLGRGMGINALVVAVSAAAGPTVAAGVLSVAPWPWLFAVNLPLGARSADPAGDSSVGKCFPVVNGMGMVAIRMRGVRCRLSADGQIIRRILLCRL